MVTERNKVQWGWTVLGDICLKEVLEIKWDLTTHVHMKQNSTANPFYLLVSNSWNLNSQCPMYKYIK